MNKREGGKESTVGFLLFQVVIVGLLVGEFVSLLVESARKLPRLLAACRTPKDVIQRPVGLLQTTYILSSLRRILSSMVTLGSMRARHGPRTGHLVSEYTARTSCVTTGEQQACRVLTSG